METKFLEVTNGPQNWGKFMLGRWTSSEWQLRSEVDPGGLLLAGRGWSPQHTLMVDIQTGEGAVFAPGGLARADLDKKKIWVCPLFEPTLTWLYELFHEHHGDGNGWWHAIPAHVDLADVPFDWAGYRRSGEEEDLLEEWFRWWQDTDDAPAKMPNALHVRTAMHLQAAGKLVR